MANNRVVYGNTVVMDITDTTATASDVASGKVFYDNGGVRRTGTMQQWGVTILNAIGGNVNAYINTGVTLDGALDWEVDMTTGDPDILNYPINAYRSSSARIGGSFNVSLRRFYYYWTGVTYATHNISTDIDLTKRLTIKQNKNGLAIIQGEAESTVTYNGTTATDSSRQVTLFRTTQNNTAGLVYIHSAKISKNGTVLRDYIPARRLYDSALGMYDRANGTFYTKVGTGEFVVLE